MTTSLLNTQTRVGTNFFFFYKIQNLEWKTLFKSFYLVVLNVTKIFSLASIFTFTITYNLSEITIAEQSKMLSAPVQV